jgi:CRP/FNR family transcriptional regulator, cyclic AMP receptor protein
MGGAPSPAERSVTDDARERVGQLRALPLFRHLPDAKLEELARILVVQTVPAGELIFEEGTPGDTMFLLAAGRVRIETRVEAAGATELAVLSPGDVFGEMALIERLPRSARAVAHTNTTLFVLGGPALERWLASDARMAVGFVVELLRVLSQRLRRSSRSVTLLYDVGDLATRRYADEASFLTAALHRLVLHLEGEWSAAVYLYNEFNDEVARIAAVGPQASSFAATLPLDVGACSALDTAAFCVALAGHGDAPAGFLLARNERAMVAAEKSEAEVALTAVGHLVASALQNIQQQTEARHRERLEEHAHDSPL